MDNNSPNISEQIIMDGFMETNPLTETLSSSSSSSSNFSTSDDSSSLEESLNEFERNRIIDYVSKVVPSYTDEEFQAHFRVNRKTFDVLEETISTATVLPQYTYGKKKVTPKKGLLITLWYLSNTESFRQMSDRFGVSMDTIRNVIKKILRYFLSHSRDYIKWPSQEASQENEHAFYQKTKMHGAIGAIDCSHIRIARPNKDQESFCNRKGYNSMILQGICDHKKRFIEIFFGEPGSQHDARVLRKSNIYKRAEGNELNIGEYFLLGDSAYPCLDWLISPFRDDGTLTQNHKTFNYRHSSGRVVIEHSFGLLKSRFRRLLHGFENQDTEFIILCVVGACIFHNICITQNDMDVDVDIEEQEEPLHVIGLIQNENQGQNKRNILFQNMFAND